MARVQNYREYLKSPAWQQKRKIVLIKARYRCNRCLRRANEVHHRSYLHVGNEPFSDLEALCHSCHRKIHADLIRRRKRKNGQKRLAERRGAVRGYRNRIEGWYEKILREVEEIE